MGVKSEREFTRLVGRSVGRSFLPWVVNFCLYLRWPMHNLSWRREKCRRMVFQPLSKNGQEMPPMNVTLEAGVKVLDFIFVCVASYCHLRNDHVSWELSHIFSTKFTGLSPLYSFVVRRKILVAAGHVITQNMLGERGGRLFGLFLWQTLWVSKPQAVAKNYPLYRGSKSNLSIKNATLFLLSSKYRRLPFTK